MLIKDLLSAAATRFTTPLYVYDLREVRVRQDELLAVLPAESVLLYSMKSNPLPAVAEEVRARGARAEISSVGELAAAFAAGFGADELLYTGPGKSRSEIDEAADSGVRLFSCESLTELSRLRAVGRRFGCRLQLLLRLQPGSRPAARLSMSDGRQFGFEERDAVEACRLLAADAGVTVHGFHVFVGSQVGDIEGLLCGFQSARDSIERVAVNGGVTTYVANLGGGFPWPYASEGVGCDLAALAPDLERLVATWPSPPRELWFESGRRLCGAAGRLVTTIVDVKRRSGGPSIVVVDAGIHTLGGMSALGRVLRPKAEFKNLDAPHGAVAELVDVVGPLCTPLDRLAVKAKVHRPQVGDRLVIPNVGAYGATASLTSFLSRPAPVEVVVDSGRRDPLVGAWRLRQGHETVDLPRSLSSYPPVA